MATLTHEWPGYEPHHVTAILKTGETLHWTEFWAVDDLQILEWVRSYGIDPIWFRAVPYPDTGPPEEVPLDEPCGECGADRGHPCTWACTARPDNRPDAA